MTRKTFAGRVVAPCVAAGMCALALAAGAWAQLPVPDERAVAARRLEERIQALRAEAEALAASARTLNNELRTLEVERNLRAAEATQAAQALEAAEQAVMETTDRVTRLEEQRQNQLPALRAQLVDLYTRGSTGYLGILLGVTNLRDAGRAVRATAALVELNHQRLEEHRATLERLEAERAALEAERAALAERSRAAAAAQSAAARAVKAHAARIAEIDARRDLTARYVGELQLARQQLLEELEERGAGAPAPAVALEAFRGALGWPAEGTVAGRFGQAESRLGGTAVRNGIDIAAPLDAPVQAVHDGTVAHAGPFTGLGTLVILDHGGNDFSLYGYLSTLSVAVGDRVRSGAEVGRVGNAPAGPPALYFELRVDGRAVDPVQWLESR